MKIEKKRKKGKTSSAEIRKVDGKAGKTKAVERGYFNIMEYFFALLSHEIFGSTITRFGICNTLLEKFLKKHSFGSNEMFSGKSDFDPIELVELIKKQ